MRLRLAYWCYFVNAALLLGFGLVYLFSSRLMPYHIDAIGLPWQALEPRSQLQYVSLMKATGTGFCAAAACMLVILQIAFRQGSRWAEVVLPSVMLFAGASLFYVNLTITLATPARPPLATAALSIVLAILGALLTFLGSRSR